jgi:protein-tyrosine phosphatase
VTRFGSIMRSESLHLVSLAGWTAIESHGVRTLVDLRNPDQCAAERQSPPPTIATVNMPLEAGLDDDPDFAGWGRAGHLATPLYFGRYLARWPDRASAAVAAVARAQAGGVVVHCGKGSDRTGLVTMLILALVGVCVEDIVADYELTAAQLATARARVLGHADDGPMIASTMAEVGTTAAASIAGSLAAFPLPESLLLAGLQLSDVDALQSRLLRPESVPWGSD